MNERIKELELQVAQSFDPLAHYTTTEYSEEFNKRFAKLIIQECVSRLIQDDFGSIRGTMNIAGYRIKEHFGVE